MEPVVLPKTISPVTRSERVKRAQPREHSGGRSAFARYLRQKKENPTDAPSRPPEAPGDASHPATPERPANADGHPTPKRVDIRV